PSVAEGFFESWGRYLFNWYSFVFTVLAAIVGLLLAREFWWISLLIVVATFVASGFFAHHKHQALVNAYRRHQGELDRVKADQKESLQKLAMAEDKLRAVPLDMISRLEGIISAYSFHEVAQALIRHAELVKRIAGFLQAATKPITPSVFTFQSGEFYVVGK